MALVSPLKNERDCQSYGCLEEKSDKIQPLNKMILFYRMDPKLPFVKSKASQRKSLDSFFILSFLL